MKARLFVALWLPKEVVASLNVVLGDVRINDDALRWQSPDRWHVTLGFLGDRDIDKEVTRFSRVPAVRPEPVCLVGSGNFGRVLWVGLEASEWLSALAGAVQRTLHSEQRRFHGHVTVARSRTPAGDRQLTHARAALAGFRSPAWTPQEFTLVRSTIGPRPGYEVIARSPLTGVGAPDALGTLDSRSGWRNRQTR